MIIEQRVMAEKIIRRKVCDICGVEIQVSLACSSLRCQYCRKDLCSDCVGQEEDTTGDYRYVWCEPCWKIGEKFRPLIEEAQTTIERLYSEWQDLCIREEK